MAKTVIKEIIIVLLLILAILLVLGVFLYDYIPMNKVVPKIEQYQASNNIQEELSQSIEDTENITNPIVYEINNSDLKNYEKSKDYQKGKVNPFADTSTNTLNNTVTSNGNNTNSSNTTTNNGSEGNYLPSNGTK